MIPWHYSQILDVLKTSTIYLIQVQYLIVNILTYNLLFESKTKTIFKKFMLKSENLKLAFNFTIL